MIVLPPIPFINPMSDPLPISYSDWLKHGEKYGYDVFFGNKLLDELKERIPKEVPNINIPNPVGSDRPVYFNSDLMAFLEDLKNS